jgi:hypothetical protein
MESRAPTFPFLSSHDVLVLGPSLVLRCLPFRSELAFSVDIAQLVEAVAIVEVVEVVEALEIVEIVELVGALEMLWSQTLVHFLARSSVFPGTWCYR